MGPAGFRSSEPLNARESDPFRPLDVTLVVRRNCSNVLRIGGLCHDQALWVIAADVMSASSCSKPERNLLSEIHVEVRSLHASSVLPFVCYLPLSWHFVTLGSRSPSNESAQTIYCLRLTSGVGSELEGSRLEASPPRTRTTLPKPYNRTKPTIRVRMGEQPNDFASSRVGTSNADSRSCPFDQRPPPLPL